MTAYQDDAPLCLDESVFKSAPQNSRWPGADDDLGEDLDSGAVVLHERMIIRVDDRPTGAGLVRYPDCRFYGRCLDRYARSNAPGWACGGCRHHEPVKMGHKDAVALSILGAYLGLDARLSPAQRARKDETIEPSVEDIREAMGWV